MRREARVMAIDAKTYDGVTRAAFEKLRAGLEKRNIPLPPGDSGTISSSGLTGSFRFDEGAATLELTVEKYPLLLPKKMVWAGIDGAMVQARQA